MEVRLVGLNGYIGKVARDEPFKSGNAYHRLLNGITKSICCKLNECQCAIVKWKTDQGEYVQLKDVVECPKYILPTKEVRNEEV